MANKDYGTVTFEGKTYTLTQDAYVDGYGDNVAYYAHAKDENGDDFKVTWAVREDFDVNTNGDESDACDWGEPIAVSPV